MTSEFTDRRLKKGSTDVWSVREKLALASAVLRSGDQNWVSVSRSIKPFVESSRSNDWFSQINCARQYEELLEKVETPKRKRGEKDLETPGDIIVRKLTIERTEELKTLIQKQAEKYRALKIELEKIKSGHLQDKIKEVWAKLSEQKETTTLIEEKPDSPLIYKDDGCEVNMEISMPSHDSVTKQSSTALSKLRSDKLVGEQEATEEKQSEQDPEIYKSKQDIEENIGNDMLKNDIQSEVIIDKEKVADESTESNFIAIENNDSEDILISTEEIIEDINNDEHIKNYVEQGSSHDVIYNKNDIIIDNGARSHNDYVNEDKNDTYIILNGGTEDNGVSNDCVLTKNMAMLISDEGNKRENAPVKQELGLQYTNSDILIYKEGHLNEDDYCNSSNDVNTSSSNIAYVKEETNNFKETGTTSIDNVTTSSDRHLTTENTTLFIQKVIESEVEDGCTEPSSPSSSTSINEDALTLKKSSNIKSKRKEFKNDVVHARKINQDLLETASIKEELEYGKESEISSKADTTDDEEEDYDDGVDTNKNCASSTSLKLSKTSALLKPKFTDLNESLPNSPASVGNSDTEDERTHKVWKKSIMLVWRGISNHKFANIFMHPVTEDIAPGYHVTIFKPMDLNTIRKNIDIGLIRTTNEFQRDMMLMFTNAIMYNHSSHDVHKMALEMYKDSMAQIEQFVSTQMMVSAEPKLLRALRRSDTGEEDMKKRRVSEHETNPPIIGKKRKH